MKVIRPVEKTQSYIVSLAHGDDLLSELNAFCSRTGIRMGRLSGIGAVRRATIAYYDQAQHQYGTRSLDEPMEILALNGNISIKDGRPFVHAHIVLGRPNGEALGGHLCEGTEVFAAECVIEAAEGEDLVREPDAQTGLSLWRAAKTAGHAANDALPP